MICISVMVQENYEHNNFFGLEMVKCLIPHLQAYSIQKKEKALRGGNPGDEYDEEEEAGAADVLLALKTGILTIPTMSDKYF